jgi:hypothetical protein
MSDPGFTRPDLCSIRTAAEQEEPAEVVRGGLRARQLPTGRLPTDRSPGERHRPCHLPHHRGGCARRFGHRGLCLLLARLRCRPGPRRDRDNRPARAHHDRWPRLRQFDGGAVRGPAPGAGALPCPLAARAGNRRYPHGEHGPGLVTRSSRGGGRSLAGGQPCGLVRTLVWLIRTSEPAARGTSAVHRCKGAADRAAVHPVPASAGDGDRSRGSERGTPGQAWRPAGQAAGQRDVEVL